MTEFFTGICPVCKNGFRSKTSKKFCSLKCYTSSDEFKARTLALCVTNTKKKIKYPQEMVLLVCVECSKEFYVKPVRHYREKAKFCSLVCYRAFMAKRFDRWIANPEKISLPQCFDEFLSKQELPCLVDGCNWRGKSLGFHVNRAHGIKAREFKKLAGFNLHSGLVTPELSKLISDRAIELGIGHENLHDLYPVPNPQEYRSLESREHIRKGQALTQSTMDPRKFLCRTCGAPFEKSIIGSRPKYCSVKCRTKFYRKRRWKLECSHCGVKFLAERCQWRRYLKGLPVCCTMQCVAARNRVLTKNYQIHIRKATNG